MGAQGLGRRLDLAVPRGSAGARRTAAGRLEDVPDEQVPVDRLLVRARERRLHRAALTAAARLLPVVPDRDGGR
ncbi:hypothetical protein [Kitasatospora sp. NPDC094016]|uniref:hypothetical protein n=1 Tax=Kitasatospora sp. NPDC094016 TaxID=3154986 RepID=UPI00331A99A3